MNILYESDFRTVVNRKMKIAIASLGDPSSASTWSGIPATIIMGLEQRGHHIFPIALSAPAEPWHYAWLKRFYHRVHNKWFLAAVEEKFLRKICLQLDHAVASMEPDVVLVIHGDWLAYATFDVPSCIIHDTTFASIVDYYPSFSNLAARSLRQGNQMYQRALDRADAAVFPASWASLSAVADYNTPPSKVFTIPFGANVSYEPSESDIEQWIEQRIIKDLCSFVFIGTQWERKGGPQALDFIAELNRIGLPSRLTIVGCEPEIHDQLRYAVDVVGYLRKDVAEDEERFRQILKDAHALIVPSQAECFGCVYCEANAYGLPALGRDTGGVSEIISDDHNGLLLRKDETPWHFARRWARIWMDRDLYRMMSVNAYREYESRLSTKAFTDRLEPVLTQLSIAP